MRPGSAVAQIELPPSLDLGQLGIARGLKLRILDAGVGDDVLVAHHDRGAAIDDCAAARTRRNHRTHGYRDRRRRRYRRNAT